MADKFDIAELKVMSKEKFKAQAQYWPWWDLPTVVQEVLASTPSNDRDLRDAVIDVSVRHMAEITGYCVEKGVMKAWEKALKQDPDFMFALLKRSTWNNCFDTVESSLHTQVLMEKLGALRATRDTHTAQITTLEASVDDFHKRISGLLSTMLRKNPNTSCRHCGKPLEPLFEPRSKQHTISGGSLRCKECRTRHEF